MKRKFSIFVKFLLVALICIIVPLAVSGYYSVNSLSSSLENDAKNSLTSSATEKKSYIDLAINDQLNLATSIANESENASYFTNFKNTNQPDQVILNRI